MLLSAALMGALVWFLAAQLAPWLTGPLNLKIMAILALVGAGIVGYGVLAHVTGAMRFGEARAFFRRPRD